MTTMTEKTDYTESTIEGVGRTTKLQMAIDYHQTKDYFKAKKYFKKAVKLGDQLSAAEHTKLGFSLIKTGDLSEAIHHYKQATKRDPKDATLFYNLGLALYTHGEELYEAEGAYLQAIKLDPFNECAYSNLGALQKSRGRIEEALANYQNALHLNPNNLRSNYNLANVYKDLGQLE